MLSLFRRRPRPVPDDDPVAAVDRLAERNRLHPDPDVQRQLIALRLEAGAHLQQRPGREPWPPTYADPFPGRSGRLPETAPGELTVERVAGAVAHHGAVVVRGLVDPERTRGLVELIDRVHDRTTGVDRGGPAPADPDALYDPVVTSTPLHTEVLRSMVTEQGGVWLADSPAATAATLDHLRAVGVIDLFARHFGGRPVFSLQKSTLRRSPAEWRITGWHQDGAFLGADVRTMNVWVALSPCGGDRPTPGLEVVPRRMERILPVVADEGRNFVDFDVVDRELEVTPSVVPSFEPGDALIFDERFLHRTHLPQDVTDPRYALECWFFCPSHPGEGYVSLLA